MHFLRIVDTFAARWTRYIAWFSLAIVALSTLLCFISAWYLMNGTHRPQAARWDADTFEVIYHRLIRHSSILISLTVGFCVLIVSGVVRRWSAGLVLVLVYALMGLSSWLALNLFALQSLP